MISQGKLPISLNLNKIGSTSKFITEFFLIIIFNWILGLLI